MPNFDVSHIRDLARQWVTAGENLWEYLEIMHGSMQAMATGWTGRAARAAQDVWNGNGQHNVWQSYWQAGWVAQELGKAIDNYADQMQAALDDIQRSYLIEALTAIFGAVIGIASFGIGGILGRVASLVAGIVEDTVATIMGLSEVVAGIAGKLAGFGAQVAENVGLQIGIDAFAQLGAQWAAGVPNPTVNWAGEATSLPWAAIPMGFGGKGVESRPVTTEINPGRPAHLEVPSVTVPIPSESSSFFSHEATSGFSTPPIPHLELPSLAMELGTQASHLSTPPRVDLATPALSPSRAGAGAPGKDTPGSGVVHPADSGFAEAPGIARPESPVPSVAGVHDPYVYGNAPAMTFSRGDATPITPQPSHAALDAQPGIAGGGRLDPSVTSASGPLHNTVTDGRGPVSDVAGTRDVLPLATRNAVPGGGGREAVQPISGTSRAGTHEEVGLTTTTSRGVDSQAVRGPADGEIKAARIATDSGAARETLGSAQASGNVHEASIGAGASRSDRGVEGVVGRPDTDGMRSSAPDSGAVRRADAMPQNPRDAAGVSGGRKVTDASPLTKTATEARPVSGDHHTVPDDPDAPRDTGSSLQTSADREPAGTTTKSLASSHSESSAGAHRDVGSDAVVHGDDHPGAGADQPQSPAHGQAKDVKHASDLVPDDGSTLHPAHDAGASPHQDGRAHQGGGGVDHHLKRDSAAEAAAQREWKWEYAKGKQKYLTERYVDEEARVDRLDLDRVWDAAFVKYLAIQEEPRLGIAAPEAVRAREDWRLDITKKLREYTNSDLRVPDDVFSDIVSAARDNAYKYLLRADDLRRYTDDIHEQIAAYKANPFGYGDELPSLNNLSVPHAYDEALQTYVMDVSKPYGHANVEDSRPGYISTEATPRDFFRHDPQNDYTVLEKYVISMQDRFTRAYEEFVRDPEAQESVPQLVRERVDALFEGDSINRQLDYLATREREIGLTWNEQFHKVMLGDAEGVKPAVVPDAAGDAEGVKPAVVPDAAGDAEGVKPAVVPDAAGDAEGVKPAVVPDAAGDAEGVKPAVVPDAAGDAEGVKPAVVPDAAGDAEGVKPAVVPDAAGDAEGVKPAVVPESLDGVSEKVLAQVELDVRDQLRWAYDKFSESSARGLAGWTWAVGDLHTRIEQEDFIHTQLKVELYSANEVLNDLGFLGDEARQRVLGEYALSVRSAAGKHFMEWHRDGRDVTENAAKWANVRDELRFSLPERAHYESALQDVVVEAAKDYHEILGHPDSHEAFDLADATRERLGGELETSRVTEHVKTFAPDYNAKEWIAHQANREDLFSAELNNLRNDPYLGRTPEPGDRFGSVGDAPTASTGEARSGGPEAFPSGAATDEAGNFLQQDHRADSDPVLAERGPTRAGDGVTSDSAPQEKLQVRAQREPSALPGVSVRNRASEVSLAEQHGPAEAIRGAGSTGPALADAVRGRLRERGQVEASDAEVRDVYERAVADDDEFDQMSATAQASVLTERVIEQRDLPRMVALHDGVRDRLSDLGYAPASDVEVRRAFGRLVSVRPEVAGLDGEAQASAVVDALGESLAVAVQSVSGVRVDVAVARRIDGELSLDLGPGFWRRDAAGRARDVIARLRQEQALSPAAVADVVEGRAAFARGQEPVRAVLGWLEREPGANFSQLSVQERVDAVIAGVKSGRTLLRAANALRGGRDDFLKDGDVLPVYEALLQKSDESVGRGAEDSFRQKSVPEQAGLVVESLEVDRTEDGQVPESVAARGSDHQALVREVFSILRSREHGFTAADVDRVRHSLERQVAGFGKLSLLGQAARIAEGLVTSQSQLERAVNGQLRRSGADVVGSDEIYRIHRTMAALVGEGFSEAGIAERSRAVAGFAKSERDLIQKVNSLRRGRRYPDLRVRSVHEKLFRELGRTFQQLPLEERARQVVKHLDAESPSSRAEVPMGNEGSGSATLASERANTDQSGLAAGVEQAGLVVESLEVDRTEDGQVPESVAARGSDHQALVREVFSILRSREHGFTAADVDRVRHSLERQVAGFGKLSLLGQAARIAEGLVTSQSQLERAVNGQLRRSGADVVGSDEIYRIHRTMAALVGEGFSEAGIAERSRAVAGFAKSERDLIQKVNSLRRGRRYPDLRVRSVHEKLFRELGRTFQQLPLEERARQVVKHLDAESPSSRAEVPMGNEGSGSATLASERANTDQSGLAAGVEQAGLVVESLEVDRTEDGQVPESVAARGSDHQALVREVFSILRSREHGFTAADVDRVRHSLERQVAGFGKLSLLGQAARIAEGLVTSQSQLERAVNGQLRKWGAETVGSDEIYRIHEGLVRNLGEQFRQVDVAERSGAVAEWALMEQQLIRAVNSVRGARGYPGRRVRSVHEKLFWQLGRSFQQLPLEDKAQQVVKHLDAESPARGDSVGDVVPEASAGVDVGRASVGSLWVADGEADVDAAEVGGLRGDEVPEKVRLLADLPGEVNTRLWRIYNARAVEAEQVIEVYRQLEVSQGAAFSELPLHARFDAVAQHIANLDLARPSDAESPAQVASLADAEAQSSTATQELELATNAQLQVWGADTVSAAEVHRVHRALQQQLHESFQGLSLTEQALDVAVQIQSERNAASTVGEAVPSGKAAEASAADGSVARAEDKAHRQDSATGAADGLEKPSPGTGELLLENTLPVSVRKALEKFPSSKQPDRPISDDEVLKIYRSLEQSAAFKGRDPMARIQRVAEYIVGHDPRLPGGAQRESRADNPVGVGSSQERATTGPDKSSSVRDPRVIRGASKLVPIGSHLDQVRPPRVDTALPPASVASKVLRVQFRDGSQMPPYMAGNINEWISDLPQEVQERSFTFGHSKRELRGVDLAIRNIVDTLGVDAGTRPKHGGIRLLQQMETALQGRDPMGLFADGAQFAYKTVKRRTLVLKLELRSYGHWQQVEYGGNPVKVDTMRQFTSTSGRIESNGASWGLTPTMPLGVWNAVTNWWARISIQVKFGKQMDYDLNKKTEIEDKTHTTNARPYLDDAWYEVSIEDTTGRPVDLRGKPVRRADQQAAKLGFAVHDGLLVWLDRSVTSVPFLGASAPPPLTTGVEGSEEAGLLGAGAPLRQGAPPPKHLVRSQKRPRFKITEAYGPMVQVRQWALQQLGVPEFSAAATATREFFSSERFHEMSPILDAGEVMSPILHGGRSGLAPLGFFSVRVESGPAVLVSVAEDAATAHAVQAYVPNGRMFKRSRSAEVSAAAGPSFQVSDLTDLFGMRASAGVNVALGSSSARATELGNTAGARVNIQHVGMTGLYWVRKQITVHAPIQSNAPTPEPATNDSGYRVLRKNPPGWMQRPATATFDTWALERLPLYEARRLAQDVAAPAEASRQGQVPAPPYLSENNPSTLGMSQVEDITFVGGAAVRGTGTQTVTFLDDFRDKLMRKINEEYPNIIALDEHLSPDDPVYRNDEDFRTAVYNRMELHKLLERDRVLSNLNEIMTTGDVTVLVLSRRFTQGPIYVRLGAKLAGLQYEGRHEGLRINHSKLTINSVSGQQSASHSVRVGLEASLSLRDARPGMGGGPLQSGTAFVGARAGRTKETASGYGIAVVREPKAQGSGVVHRWSYGVVLTAEIGGYVQPRLRHLIPGASASAFVSEQQPVSLFDDDHELNPRDPGNSTRSGVGEVWLRVPIEHTPIALPAVSDKSVPTEAKMSSAEARGLVMGTLKRAQSGSTEYPLQVISVTGSTVLDSAMRAVLGEASGNSWKLRQTPAPMLSGALRRIASTALSGNFAETSAPAGLRMWGSMPTRLFFARDTAVVHRTSIDGPLLALTPAMAIQAGSAMGSFVLAASHGGWTNSYAVGAQAGYARSHSSNGPVANYVAGLFPFLVDTSGSEAIQRSAYGELNESRRGYHYLVTGDVVHEIAAASGRLGERMRDRPLMPASVDGVAGRRVTVPEGIYGHMRESDAHLHGVIIDHLGEVPQYGGAKKWRPLLAALPFASWPVNSLDTAAPVAKFLSDLTKLGLPPIDLEQLRRLVSQQIMLTVGKETTGRGVSMPARIGRWGTQEVRLHVTLQPVAANAGEFVGLGHSISLNDYREARETIEQTNSRTSGAMLGLAVSIAANTGNLVAGTAGSTYAQSDFSKHSATRTQTDASISASMVSMDGPYAEHTTQYELELRVEVIGAGAAGKPPSISSKTKVGGLTERFPLSLMRPEPPSSQQELPFPEFREEYDIRRADDRVLAAVRGRRWHKLRPRGASVVTKPFQLPAEGYVVRGVIGRKNLANAITLALGAAYQPSLILPKDAPIDQTYVERAMDTPLTRPGTVAAQNLESATSHLALTAFYGRTLEPDGYKARVSVRSVVGGADGRVTLFSKPDFRGAQILTVAENVHFSTGEQTLVASGTAFGRIGSTDRTLDAGPAVTTGAAGTSQLGSGPAAQGSDATTVHMSGQSLISSTAAPSAGGRAVLLAVPTKFVVEAAVHHHLADSAPARVARSPFGPVQRQPQVLETEATVLAWVSLEQADLLGLADKVFAPPVASAWDEVGRLQQSFIDADTAYWDARRNADGVGLVAKVRKLEDQVLEATARTDAEVETAAYALAVLREGEPDHEGWEDERTQQIQEATARLRQALADAREMVAAAGRERDAAQTRLEETMAQLQVLRRRAESFVDLLADARLKADWLTRKHQATVIGGDQGGATAPSDLQRAELDPAHAPSSSQQEHTGARDKWTFETFMDTSVLIATLPDGSRRVFDLRPPGGDGNRFYAAVWTASGFHGGNSVELAKKVARRSQLLTRTDLDLDPQAVYDVSALQRMFQEIFRAEPGLSAEITKAGGRLPSTLFAQLTGDPNRLASLFSLHLKHAYRWDKQTEAIAASLTVRHMPRDLIIVAEDGSYQYYSSTQVDQARAKFPMIVYRQGSVYLATVLRPGDTRMTDSLAEERRKKEIREGKQRQQDVLNQTYEDAEAVPAALHEQAPADLVAAVAQAVAAEPSLQGLDPDHVVRAFALWSPLADWLVGTDARTVDARDEWYSGLASVARTLGDRGEEAAAEEAVRLSPKMDNVLRRGGAVPEGELGGTAEFTDGPSTSMHEPPSALVGTMWNPSEASQLPVRVVRHVKRFNAKALGLTGPLMADLAAPNLDEDVRERLLTEVTGRVMKSLGHFRPADNNEVFIDEVELSDLVGAVTIAQRLADLFEHRVHVVYDKKQDAVRICPNEKKLTTPRPV